MGNLCVSRKLNERVRVIVHAQEIWITVTEIRSDKVRLLFTADKDAVNIVREELIDAEGRPVGRGVTS